MEEDDGETPSEKNQFQQVMTTILWRVQDPARVKNAGPAPGRSGQVARVSRKAAERGHSLREEAILPDGR